MTFIFFVISFLAAVTSYAQASLPKNPFQVVLVDKKNFKLHLAEYLGSKIEIKKSIHVTLGKADGDKQVEKDLKTPEGIYFFTTKLKPPTLKKKFGDMALMIDYPNVVDRMNGKTGYDIMLHATDEPERLKKDRDSEGCVVVGNQEIDELSKHVTLGLTPIIVYPELDPKMLSENGKPEVKAAFDKWLKAWQEKDLDRYIGSYVSGFKYSGMNLKQYREYKAALNQKYSEINVEANYARFYYHPKYNVVTFNQKYESKLKNGRPGFRSLGTKVLYFVKDGDTYKIASEGYGYAKEK